MFAALFGGAADAQQVGRPDVVPQANGLYAPPGYRPRTPPPQPAPPAERAMGGGGRVMYFHKPADALIPNDLPAEGVALAAPADPVPRVGVPDVPVDAPGPRLLPTPRPLPVIPTATAPSLPPLPTYTPPAYTPVLSLLQPTPNVPIDPSVTALPPREKVFVMPNDADLARLIVKTLRDEDLQREEVKRKKGDPNDKPRAVAAADDPVWKFPNPAVLVPAGTVYQAKTMTYEQRVARIEPTYVIHRRLHFEEKNAERYGWDLGAVQPLVSTLYFYRDTLLWPQSLVSGLVHGTWDTSAGKCRPGSPVPYYVYPLGLTVTGTLAEAGLITGLSFIIP